MTFDKWFNILWDGDKSIHTYKMLLTAWTAALAAQTIGNKNAL